MTTPARTLTRLAGASVVVAGAGALAGGTAGAMPILAGTVPTAATSHAARPASISTSADVIGRGVTVTVRLAPSSSLEGPTLSDLVPAGLHYVAGSGRLTTPTAARLREPRLVPTTNGTLLVWRGLALDPRAGAVLTFGLRPGGAGPAAIGDTWSQVVTLHPASLAVPEALAAVTSGTALPTPKAAVATLGRSVQRTGDTVPVVAASAVETSVARPHLPAGQLAEELTVVSAPDRIGPVLAQLWLPAGLTWLHTTGPTPQPTVRTVHVAVSSQGLPLLHPVPAGHHRHQPKRATFELVTWKLHRPGTNDVRHLGYVLSATPQAAGAGVLVTATSELAAGSSATLPASGSVQPTVQTTVSTSVDHPVAARTAVATNSSLHRAGPEVLGVAGSGGGGSPTSGSGRDPFLDSSPSTGGSSSSSSGGSSSSGSSSSSASSSTAGSSTSSTTTGATLASTGLDATRLGELGLALVVGGLGVAAASMARRPRRSRDGAHARRASHRARS